MTLFIKYFWLIFYLLLILSFDTIAQEDSTKIAKPLVNISDSVSVEDSLKQIKIKSLFLINLKSPIKTTTPGKYYLTKNGIDRIDYKYTGDIILHLPFASLNNFGYSGAPSESFIFSYGYGNSTIAINNNSLNNLWNNSSDLNKIQTEDISKIEIIPITRSFLYGIFNNPSVINVTTIDSLRTKPLTRIRYFQAPNNEGFIDASFNARVMRKLAIGFRVTNTNTTGELKNTNYESWKINLKGVYKFADSLYGKINYYHLKSGIELNGGINVNSFGSPSSADIYNQFAPVLFNDRYNKTTIHNIDAGLYGYLFKDIYFRIMTGQYYNSDKFNQNKTKAITDSTRIVNENKYNLTFAKFTAEQKFKKLSLKLSSGYEYIKYSVQDIDYYKDGNNYFAWMSAKYNLLDSSVVPSVFGKLSQYHSQSNNGIGADVRFKLFNSIQLYIGYSNFEKPYSIVEKVSLPGIYLDKTQLFNNYFTTIEYQSHFLNASISYFNSKSYNTPIPIFNNKDITLNSTEIIFNRSENLSSSGVNIKAEIKLWQFLININSNYYNLIEPNSNRSSENYNLISGLYYTDTLYNSNLYLKTGFTFYLNSNTDFLNYDFQKLRSSRYYYEEGNITPFSTYNISNNPYRLDFFLSGRIQKLATFFFTYENILGNDYFLVPYYPVTSGGFRLGISWDFIN